MGNKKSMKMNVILNVFNTVLTMSFSLLTYPYASRILGATNLGKINFSQSIVSYFALLAALGFNTYAIREGARIREDKNKVNIFSNEVFSLNGISTIISFILMIIVVVNNARLNPYLMLACIQAIALFSDWICVSWINVIFEDFLFITIRSIITQVLALIFLFIFVRNKNDYYIYTLVISVSRLIPSIFNFVHVKKYCNVKFTNRVNVVTHIKPVLVFFSNTIAVSIYLNADVTMIGLMLGDFYVGVYSVAVKIYTAIRTIIAAVYSVAIPRVSNYVAGNEWNLYKILLNRIFNAILFISIPATVMCACLSKDIILILSGSEYLEAASPLAILAITFIVAVMGGFLAYCVAIPLRKEKIVLIATIISAIENIVLNLYFIPNWGISGAAWTTFLSELTVCVVLFAMLRKNLHLFNWKGIFLCICKCVIAAVPIPYILAKMNCFNMVIIDRAFQCIVAGGCYLLLNFFLKNNILRDVLKLHK